MLNPEKHKQKKKEWIQKNPDKVKIHLKNQYDKNKNNVKYRVCARMRNGITKCLRKGRKTGSWMDMVPYTINDLVKRLKNTMPDEYTWDDFLQGRLHIDHIVPVSAFSFEYSTDHDFQRCWALSNLRLLPASENCSKGNRLLSPFQVSLPGM